MWGLGSLVGTALALVLLEVLVTSGQQSGSGGSQVGSLLQVPGELAQAWLDPSRPLIPDKRSTPSAPAASSTSTAPSTVLSAA